MIASSAESIGPGGATAPGQLFVINLAASTSPMALSNPTSPALKRFTFFVSRQREDGRERFRLHMGYFSTQEEAEALLDSVRDIYPAAWAGPAPSTGKGRRGRIAPGSVVTAAPAPAPAAAVAAPVVPAAPVVAAAVRTPPQPAAPVAVKPAAVAVPNPVAAKATAAPALDTMSNVRDVLAQLSEERPAAPAAATVAPRAAPARAAPPAPAAARPAPAPAPAAAPVAGRAAAKELTGADALTLLESPVPRPMVAPPPAAPKAAAAPMPKAMPALPPLKNPFEGLENEPEVRVVTPEDTQTLTDIKVDKQNNAPPCFAVQLIWSVSPIDVAALPHLAIFDAYTLYNVEGNRQGRKWFGLRLGFFSDPNSASQVANYVRSDYKNVAVVPVAVKERDRAKGGAAPAPQAGDEPQKTSDTEFKREAMAGFELLADDHPPTAKRDLDDTVRIKAPVAAAVKPVAAAPARPAPPPGAPKATGKPTGKRVVARRRAPPPAPGRTVSAGVGGAEVLESTLEILGASTLSLENGGRETITDAAARKDVKKSSGNRFSRLLSKLGGG